MDYVDLGKRIRARRQHLGLTQEQLAKEMGVSTSFMGHIERGTRKASLETLVQLANVMDVSIDGLLTASLNRSNDTKRQKAMRDLLSTYQIRKRMTESSHLVRREYRRRHGEDYRNAAIILQAARFENGTVRDVVIAMRKHVGNDSEL